MDNPAWDFLNRRQSTPSRLLGEPGPSESQTQELVRLAARVPDHGRLHPWRFIRIANDARRALGEKTAAIHRERGASEAEIEKDLLRFTYAPLIIAVIAKTVPGHKIPEIEQLFSAGCAAYNLLLGAESLGFSAQWLTGWAAYDPQVGKLLGLVEHERIIAFVHIGTTRERQPDRARPDPAQCLTDWND